jgi:hypothetical protein
VSDLTYAGVTKFDRTGKQTWQAAGNFLGMHGHELLPNGNLLWFQAHNGNNAQPLGAPSPVYEYSFAGGGGASSAKLEWTYVGDESSFVLGDVQRLPNGNTLVTYSLANVLQEVTPAGEVVQALSGSWGTFSGELGYTWFRKTLYGPPQ